MENRKPKNTSKTNNPFSFRNFLTSTNNDTSINHNHVNDNTSNFNTTGTSNRSENPYSFARFIQNADSPRQMLETDRNENVTLQTELPDFVQDQIGASNDISGEYSNISVELPDFTRHTNVNSLATPNLTSQAIQSNEEEILSSSTSSHNSLNENLSASRIPVSNSTNLPDFLSDTGISLVPKENGISQHNINTNARLNDNPSHLGSNSLISNEDNIPYVTRINRLEEEIRQKNSRIHLLEQQLMSQKQKEEEETEMMESVMRQVDENLQSAVDRWRIAEAEVERLSTRVIQLESQLEHNSTSTSSIGTRNNPYVSQMHIVRDLGVQLGSDLLVADSLFKRLLEHSDKMKLLAGHLQYLDRVEDISEGSPTSQRNNNSSKNDA